MTQNGGQATYGRVPGVFALTLLNIASKRGHAASDLLMHAGVDVAPEDIVEVGLPLDEHLNLIQIVEQTLDDPALAVELGWELAPTALGNVGQAIVASANMGDVLGLLERYWPLMHRSSTLVVDVTDEVGVIELEIHLPPTSRTYMQLAELCLVGLHRGVVSLLPAHAETVEAWFDFSEPAHVAAVRRRLPHARYDMPSCQFRFPTSALEAPLALANSASQMAAVARCERERQETGLERNSLSARVQAELVGGRYPNLERMARGLGMSARTMRRRLHREGTTYSHLVDAARRREAVRLLDRRELSVGEVAALLGYEVPANFTRAFRRWTGQTPSAYRDARA